MRLSLVIPFYNEQENIRRVVNDLVSGFEQSSVDYELILVNNGSVDASPQILEELAKGKQDRIKVIHVPVNEGYGWGIINGLGNTSGDFVGFMCGDGQTDTNSLLEVFSSLRNDNYDLVKVKRVVRRDGITRKFLSAGYNRLFGVLFNTSTKDVNGSPKVWKREFLDVINPVSKDWFIDAEIMIKAKCLNLKVGEIPIEFLRREKGKSHVAFNTILEFTRNMLNQKFGRGMREWKQKISRS